LSIVERLGGFWWCKGKHKILFDQKFSEKMQLSVLFLTIIEEISVKNAFFEDFLFCPQKNVYLCDVQSCRHVKMVVKKRRTLHKVKASSMLCQLAV